jgi:hypothetical protein
MSDDGIEGNGAQLHDDLERERNAAAGRAHGWRCSAGVRAHVVAYAVTCVEHGESHARIARRLGLTTIVCRTHRALTTLE